MIFGNATKERALDFSKEQIVEKFPLIDYEELEDHQSKPLVIGNIYSDDVLDIDPIFWDSMNDLPGE